MKDSTNGVRYQTNRPANSHTWAAYSFGALPGQFPTPEYYNNNQYVMRATIPIVDDDPVALGDTFSLLKNNSLNVSVAGV